MRPMLLVVTAMTMMLAAPASLAQPADGPTDARRRGPQQAPDGGWRAGGGRVMAVERMARMLSMRLDLDPQQQAQFDEIVAAYKASLETADTGEPDTTELLEEMRAARDAGDEERMVELRQRMRSRFREVGGAMDGLASEIEPILRDDQLQRLEELRDRMQQRREWGMGRDGASRHFARLREQLNLDEQQREEFDRLAGDFEDRRLQNRERIRAMREVMRELRDARQAGDQDRAAELQAQIAEMRPDPSGAYVEFYDQLEPVLDEEQRAILAEFREPGAPTGRMAQRPLNLREVLRAARRIEMSDEQQRQVREIEEEAVRASRGMSREQRADLVESTRAEIAKLLDDSQRAEFDRLLSGDRSRGLRGQRPRGRGADVERADEPAEAGDESDRPARKRRGTP